MVARLTLGLVVTKQRAELEGNGRSSVSRISRRAHEPPHRRALVAGPAAAAATGAVFYVVLLRRLQAESAMKK